MINQIKISDRARIVVDKGTRKRLTLLKAELDFLSTNNLINFLIDLYEKSNKK